MHVLGQKTNSCRVRILNYFIHLSFTISWFQISNKLFETLHGHTYILIYMYVCTYTNTSCLQENRQLIRPEVTMTNNLSVAGSILMWNMFPIEILWDMLWRSSLAFLSSGSLPTTHISQFTYPSKSRNI